MSVTSVDTLEERYRLHEEVLDRMVNPLRQPFANDRDVTLIKAVERIRSAVAKASDVIPISVQKALGKFSMVEENSDSEEESSDADDDAVNFAGFPHGMYYTWSKMKAPTKPRIKWSKIWNKPMLLGKFGPGGDFTGTEFGFPEPESFKNATSSLFDRNSWRPDDDSMSKEAEDEIKGLSRQLAGILEQLGGEPISDARRAELIGRESQLRAEKLLLLTKEQQLRDEKKDLRARLPAPQQQGAEPPSFFSKQKLGLRKIFLAGASCC